MGSLTPIGGGGGGVATVTGGAPIASSGGANPNITHNNSGVAAGLYFNSTVAVDALGHVTGAAGGLILAKSFVAVVAPLDAAENILFTIPIPALPANAVLRIFAGLTMTGNANAKTLRARLSGIGGTILYTFNYTGSASGLMELYVANRNSALSQYAAGYGMRNNAAPGSQTAVSAVDTSTGVETIVITVQKAVGADAFSLDGAIAEILSDGT